LGTQLSSYGDGLWKAGLDSLLTRPTAVQQVLHARDGAWERTTLPNFRNPKESFCG
jgi:hypothetical protein